MSACRYEPMHPDRRLSGVRKPVAPWLARCGVRDVEAVLLPNPDAPPTQAERCKILRDPDRDTFYAVHKAGAQWMFDPSRPLRRVEVQS